MLSETKKSQLVAVGLWDDFSVRLLNLGDDPSMVLEQVLHINLGRGNNEASSSSQLASNEDSDDQPDYVRQYKDDWCKGR